MGAVQPCWLACFYAWGSSMLRRVFARAFSHVRACAHVRVRACASASLQLGHRMQQSGRLAGRSSPASHVRVRASAHTGFPLYQMHIECVCLAAPPRANTPAVAIMVPIEAAAARSLEPTNEEPGSNLGGWLLARANTHVVRSLLGTGASRGPLGASTHPLRLLMQSKRLHGNGADHAVGAVAPS